jgi:hypothetical protein
MQYPMAAICVNAWAREQGKAWVGSLSVMWCGYVRGMLELKGERNAKGEI